MNIFAVDTDATRAANMLCLKHVCKMVVESAQLLCNAFPEDTANLPYKRTHIMHPCSRWASHTRGNWEWLFTHGYSLCQRYQRVFLKTHKCMADYMWMSTRTSLLSREMRAILDKTDFPLCMPEKFKGPSFVTSYRRYYWEEKAYFAKWESIDNIPNWWPVKTNSFVRKNLR